MAHTFEQMIGDAAEGSISGAYAGCFGYLDAAVELFLQGHISKEELGSQHQELRNTLALVMARRAEKISNRREDPETDAHT